jgi:hypothetical protein
VKTGYSASRSALETIRDVSVHVDGKLRTGITPGSDPAREVLKAIGLTERHPPEPLDGDETTM